MLFGSGWIDADHDGCDTREEVLIVESIEPATTSSGCSIASGKWLDAYTGATFTVSGELDIDHLVPLANAWRSGASAWTPDQRIAFANDLDRPEALIAVSASANRSKGDRSPDEWKPPNSGAWCSYARSWITVKAKWKLTVTTAEKAALGSMLTSCSS